MERAGRRKRQIPEYETPGIEELNLVEFPMAVLADRQPDGTKTLEFEDEISDRESRSRVRRRVTITGSDKWGLPTWQDNDILLALMKLTNDKNGFQDRRVEFSLYELRELLRWPKDGRYKSRLKAGLKTILGVTVAYENAFRKRGRWVSLEGFHLIDNVRLTNTIDEYDPEEAQLFKWNDTVVESIQASNTKGLDWDFYLDLNTAVSKRLYRFLDKRFALSPRWTWPLIPFCENKIGFAHGSYRPVDCKRKLRNSLSELTDKGVIAPMPESERFEKVGKGLYVVHFRKARAQRQAAKKATLIPEVSGLEKELLDRDVRNAATLVDKFDEDKIRAQIANFDHRNANGENLGGAWLRKAIEEPQGYGMRKDYKSPEEIAAAKKKREATLEAEKKREEAEKAKRDGEQKRIDDYIDRLTPGELSKLEEESLAANRFLAEMLRKADTERAGEYRTMALRLQVAKLIEASE